jgi:ferredoxin-NADP reductase
MITAERKYGRYVLLPASQLFNKEAVDDLDEMKLWIDEVEEHRNCLKQGASSPAQPCMIPPRWVELQLGAIRPYNGNASIFTFRLPSEKLKLGLPAGAYLLVKAPNCEHDGGGDAIRPYTSVSDPAARGTFDILVKRYDEWGVPSNTGTSSSGHSVNPYRPKGAVSTYIHSLSVGDTLHFKYSKSCRSKLSSSLLVGKPKKKRRYSSDGTLTPPGSRTMQQHTETTDEEKTTTAVSLVEAQYSPSVCDNPGVLWPSPPPSKGLSAAHARASPRHRLGVVDTSAVAHGTMSSKMHRSDIEPRDGDDDSSFDPESDSEQDVDYDNTLNVPDLKVDHLTLLAVGAGVAPIIQILRMALYGKSEGDIDTDECWSDWMEEQTQYLSRIEQQQKQEQQNFTYSTGRGPSITFRAPNSWSSGDKNAKSTADHWNSDKKSHWLQAPYTTESMNSSTHSSSSNTPTARSCTGSVSRFRLSTTSNAPNNKFRKIVFLYGCRTVDDCLMKEQLLQYERDFPSIFKIVFCVGSRYDNVHIGAKADTSGTVKEAARISTDSTVNSIFTKISSSTSTAATVVDRQHDGPCPVSMSYVPPSPASSFAELEAHKEVGWINLDHIKKHQALSPLDSSESAARTRVVVCGLPSVYERLCGSRFTKDVPDGTILKSLGYTEENVIKL